jgi:hypothetical protein
MATPLASIEDGASNVANGKKVKSTSPVPCYLLELPWEVRNKILRYLLYSDEPLRLLERGLDDDENESEEDEDGTEADESEDDEDDENQSCDSEDDEDDQIEEQTDEVDPKEGYYKNYAFSPQVRRTCRQLYDEAKLVLDSNIIGIDLCRHIEGEWQWAIAVHCQRDNMGTGMWLDQKVKGIFHQAERFHIFMDLRELREEYSFDQCLRYSPAPQLCKNLVGKQNLKQCRVDITVEGFGGEEEFFYGRKGYSLLASFHMLRCKEFSISGCNEAVAQRLEWTILADEPVRNLWKMHDALEKFVTGSSCLRDDLDHSRCKLDYEHSDDCSALRSGLMSFFGDHDNVFDCFTCDFYWDFLSDAINWGDVHEFLSLRSSLLEVIDDYQAKKKRELLLLDFACKRSVEEEK